MPAPSRALSYIAPDALFGRYTTRADVYSFGMLIYTVLHHQRPFAGMAPMAALLTVMQQQRRPPVDVPAELAPIAALMNACWSADPELRPPMSEVAELLRRELAGVPMVMVV